MKVNLWWLRETELARFYCRHSRHPEPEDCIWVPKSIIEHTSKNAGGHHVVELPDWFVRRENL